MKWLAPIFAVAFAIAFAGWGLDRLAKARQAEIVAVHGAREPSFVFPAGGAIAAPDAERAAQILARRVGDAASAMGVRLESRPADTPMAGFVALDVVITGPESAVRGFARRLESGPALLRLVIGTMRPAGGGVLLRARALAPWRR